MAHKIISSSVEHVPDANSIFASADAEGSISRGYGNSTDINLNLVLLLRSLDIQAFPLLLSSQQNGEADPYMSSAYDYNYVIAGLRIDSVEYLLDATCPVSCLDLLPFRCLNEYGRTVEPGEGKIVDLMSRRKAKYISSFESEISIDGTSNGKGMLRLKDYAAYDPNQYGLVAINGQEFIRSTFSDLKISGTVRESEANSPNELLKNLEFDFDIENQSLTEGAISFRPVKNALLSESLFQEETRICPIEFDYPVEIQESYTYRIPAGTVIEHIPEPFIVSVPGDGMKFRYQATQIGDKIMVQASFERSQLIFSQLDYDIVRGFYNQMNQKISEKIVLRIVE